MKKFRTCSLLLFLLNSAILSHAQSIDWHKLESEASNLITQNHGVGTSVIVVNKDSVLFYKGLGNASLESKYPVTDSTLFVLGSITKTFTALGILKLVEEGKLELEDEVRKLAPELPFVNEWEDEYPLKVYHLLEHTSGFDELHFKDRSIPVRNDEFPLLHGLEIVKNSLKTRWKPGTQYAYSNVGYLAAGYLIEKVSGRGYNDFISQEVLKPLRMTNSSIRLKDVNQQLLAKSYSYSNKELPFKHIFTRPTGSLISSSRDMGSFLMMLLNKGEPFLDQSEFKEFEKHHSIEAFAKTENGYRLGVYPRFREGRKWLVHGGSINKYNSEFEYCHELGLGIFVVSNGPNATKTVDGVINAFHNLVPKTAQKPMKSKQINIEANLTALEGYYILTSPRNQLLYPFTELFTEGIFVDYDSGNILMSSQKGWESRMSQTGLNSFSPNGIDNEYQYIFNASNDQLYTSLGFSYKKVPYFFILFLGFILIISFVIICSSQISLLVHLIIIIKKKQIDFSPQLIFEIGSSLFLLGVIFYLIMGTIEKIHEPQMLTILLALCTILFPIFTVLGIALSFKRRFQNSIDKIWTISLASSMTIMSYYLIYWGFFGFSVWLH
ncbi:CubicO group peptidase, beta-lactamase class C family [Marivirga sericea]|uniref:CubicO group peptidase, beta-lactamase class C family n=1 Tax=Marivirga sericea TaxID=1028 RepID=A0A1X7I5R2_9BACT|nr:serine hydrolase domain-containing protein [Marivirga sericea]SMG09195.1 CubicO group peptidase, beta-lactamase class C family [Marivirga sericea]